MPEPQSRPLKLDESAASADPSLPAFLTRPAGAPVYHGFPVVPETLTDGWCFNAITDPFDPSGADSGDAFVVAPDGTRAGLIWDVGVGEPIEIRPPEPERWGVYQVWFPRPVVTMDDLIHCFQSVLPQLQRIYRQVHRSSQQQ